MHMKIRQASGTLSSPRKREAINRSAGFPVAIVVLAAAAQTASFQGLV